MPLSHSTHVKADGLFLEKWRRESLNWESLEQSRILQIYTMGAATKFLLQIFNYPF